MVHSGIFLCTILDLREEAKDLSGGVKIRDGSAQLRWSPSVYNDCRQGQLASYFLDRPPDRLCLLFDATPCQ